MAQATARFARPAAPTNLRGASNGAGSINLYWDAPGPNLYYWVYMRDVSAGEMSFTRSANPTDQTQASPDWLRHGHTYEFKVTAESPGGEGPASSAIRVISYGGLPAAPSGLTATPGDGRVTLRWTASSTPNVWYVVYQQDTTTGQAWQRLPLPITTCCAFTAGLLVNRHTYAFKVVATNWAGDSGSSNVVSARPMAPPPAAPSGLTATPGDGRVTLRWTASSTPNVWYVVYQQDTTTGQAWQRLPLPITTCCAFTAGLLVNGHTYAFKVIATNAGGDSGSTNVVTAKPMPPFPSAPSGLTASPGDGKVTLRWTASSTPNVWYWIEYAPRGGTWQRLKYPVASCCAFTVGYLFNGTTYDFRVRATNAAGDSAASNTASARPMPPMPQPPWNLNATAGDNEAHLTWSPSPTPRVLYNIYMRQATNNGPWLKLPYPILSTAMTAGFLRYGYTYQFKVTAMNLTGESAASNTATVLIVPAWAARRCASVTSNWLLNNLGDINAIQLYDVTGTVCATRYGNNFKVEQSWNTHGKQLYDGIFWFIVTDCNTNVAVWSRAMAYDNGTPNTSGSALSYAPIDPADLYSIRVTGSGDVEGINMINSKFSSRPPRGIIPFTAQTPCF